MYAVAFSLLFAVVGCNGQSFSGNGCTDNLLQPCLSKLIGNLSSLASSVNSQSPMVPLEALNNATVNSMCKNRDSLKNFYRCALSKVEPCTSSHTQGLLPSYDRLAESIDFLCKNFGDVDLACVGRKARSATSCILAAGKDVQVQSEDDFVNNMCRFEISMVFCYKTAMASCSGRTAELMTEYMKYTNGAACDGNITRISHLLLIVSLCYTFFKNML